jgi:hypothetical protein
MFAWRRRVREAESSKFVEVQVLDVVRPSEEFVANGKSIEVRLGRGRSLLVEPGFDAEHLRALVLVLESAPLSEPRR